MVVKEFFLLPKHTHTKRKKKNTCVFVKLIYNEIMHTDMMFLDQKNVFINEKKLQNYIKSAIDFRKLPYQLNSNG